MADKKTTKKKIYKYIVLWDETGDDPHQLCGTKDEVEQLLVELFEDRDVKNDSIMVVEIKKIARIKVKFESVAL